MVDWTYSMRTGSALLLTGFLLAHSASMGIAENQAALSNPPPVYKVWIWQENGDTLWRIAQKVYGDKDKWPLIYEANKDVLKNPNTIYPKQVLKIPPIDWHP
jgi:nucleoid-associated protein YgaU